MTWRPDEQGTEPRWVSVGGGSAPGPGPGLGPRPASGVALDSMRLQTECTEPVSTEGIAVGNLQAGRATQACACTVTQGLPVGCYSSPDSCMSYPENKYKYRLVRKLCSFKTVQ